jgi:hypothetical protein
MPRASWIVCARRWFFVGCSSAVAMLGATTNAEEFPYTAYVAVERAEVVSGPGHRFYATEQLPQGAEVEVYREEPSGWLAIRPPDGSFSWVPAEAVERSGEAEAGRVVEPTPAWIGTATERVSEHRQQVTLQEGELVRILGEKTVAAEGQEQVWLKIAPPAGEFRWIHLRDVSRQMPVADSSSRPPVGTLPGSEESADLEDAEQPEDQVPPGRRDLPSQPRQFEPVAASIALRDLDQPGGDGGRRITSAASYHNPIELVQFRGSESQPRPSLSPDGFVPRKRRSSSEPLDTVPLPSPDFAHSSSSPGFSRPPVEAPRIASLGSSSSLGAATTPSAPAKPAPTVGGDLAQQLDQIEVDLSLMLAQDRSLWNLASLKGRVNQLVEGGSDPVARGRARLVLEKIEQFETAFDVRHYGAIGTSAATPTNASGSGSLADPRYDGQGWLKPVVSRKGDKPPADYALVDAEGKPVCFVSPSPGLNLHRYLNKQVGVYGRRGYIESLKTPHVVVERAIDLDRVWR